MPSAWVSCAVACVLPGDRWGGVGRVGGGTIVIVGCVKPLRIVLSWVSSVGVRHAGGWIGAVAVGFCCW
jgi:hypothetical protein